ncbi:MAG: transporter, partial [Planctomycetota bacterium]
MKKWFLFLVLTGMIAFPVFGEDAAKDVAADKIADVEEDNATELAKATQNPIADLISLPFQWNVGFDTGPDNHTSSVLNIQPVIPLSLNNDWNLITRTIVPIINQPPVGGLDRQEWELGNTQFSGFFSPKDSGE